MTSPTGIFMPRWGMTMTEGLVAAWLVEEGASVAAGQDLLEVETTKITNTVEAAAAGRLARRLVEPGAVAPVGALLGVLAEPGTEGEALDAFIAAHARPTLDADAEALPTARFEEVAVDAGRTVMAARSGGGPGVPVVLIHGFGGDKGTWLFNEPALADGREVVSLDLPGHGGSSPPGPDAGLAALAVDVGAALDQLGIGSAHLVGHSLGGAVAIRLAADRPALVRSLALVAPAGLGAEIDGTYLDGFIAAERRKPMRDVLARLFHDPAVVTTDMVEGSLRMKRTDGVTESLRRLAASLFPAGRQATDLRPVLASMAAPVLVIWGAADAILPAAQMQGLPATVRTATLPAAGHMPQMEQAGEVNRLLADHVRTNEAA